MSPSRSIESSNIPSSSSNTRRPSSSPSVFFGWMWKEGSKWKSWKRRFFVLNNRHISYYTQCVLVQLKDGSMKNIKADAKGQVQIVHAERSERTTYGIRLTLQSGKYMYIQTDAESDRKDWIIAFNSHALESVEEPVCNQPPSYQDSSSPIEASMRSSCSTESIHSSRDSTSAGWLAMKSGPFRRWKNRFIVVRGAHIQAFSKPSWEGTPLMQEDIQSVQKINAEEVLILKCISGKTIVLRTSLDRELDDWYTLLSKTIPVQDEHRGLSFP